MGTTVPFFVRVLPFSFVHTWVTAGNGPLHSTLDLRAPSVAELVRIALNPSSRTLVSPFWMGAE
jgi:hypothetical protein